MKTMNLFKGMAITALMCAFAACSNETEEPQVAPEGNVSEPAPFSINVSIGSDNSRVATTEESNVIKLTWEANDKLYMVCYADGAEANGTIHEFAIDAPAENAAYSNTGTFTCEAFTWDDTKKNVKLYYIPGTYSGFASLGLSSIDFSSQDGTVANLKNYMHMSSASQTVTDKDALASATFEMAHSVAIMKVQINKGDIVWKGASDDTEATPQTFTMKLRSTTATLTGTTDNTITVTAPNEPAWSWDATSGNIVANVAVAITGSITTTGNTPDKWVFNLQDGLNNPLTWLSSSAKVLEAGQRYWAPVTLSTADYFPMIVDGETYFQPKGQTTENELNLTTSFNEVTKTLTFGQRYAESYWHYNKGLNLAHYTYVIVDLKNAVSVSIDCAVDYLNTIAFNTRKFVTKGLKGQDTSIAIPFKTSDVTSQDDASGEINQSIIYYLSFNTGVEMSNNPPTLALNKVYVTNENPFGTTGNVVLKDFTNNKTTDAFGGTENLAW